MHVLLATTANIYPTKIDLWILLGAQTSAAGTAVVVFLLLFFSFQSIKLALLFILLDMYQHSELESSCFSPTREQLYERGRAQKEGKTKLQVFQIHTC